MKYRVLCDTRDASGKIVFAAGKTIDRKPTKELERFVTRGILEPVPAKKES